MVSIQSGMQAEALERKVIERAREDPIAFCQYVLRAERTEKPIQFDRGHEELIRKVMESKRLVVCAAPQLGKTTIITYGLHLWKIGRDPIGYRSQIGSALKENAQKHLGYLRTMIENRTDAMGRPSRLHRVFPALEKPPKTSNESVLILAREGRAKKAPTVEAIGDKARKQGFHVVDHWYDDMVDPVISQSRYLMEKQATWVMNNESRVDPDGGRYFIQNTFTRYDTGHILHEKYGWDLFLMPAVDSQGRTLYPVVWPQERVDKYNRAQYDQDLLCIPRREGDSVFEEPFIRTALQLGANISMVDRVDRNSLPEGVRIITGVDLSHRKKKTSDDTVFFTILVAPPEMLGLPATTPGKHAFRLLWIKRGKMGPPEIRANLIDHWLRFGSYFKVEDNGGQNYLRELLGLDYPEIPISPFTTSAATKASPEIGLATMAGEMSAGLWIFPCTREESGKLTGGSEVEKLLLELRNYDPSTHTPDGVMGMWMARLGARSMFEHQVSYAGDKMRVEDLMAVTGDSREAILKRYPELATEDDDVKVEMPDLGLLKVNPEAMRGVTLERVEKRKERICIAGGPGVGKSTLALTLDKLAKSTDSLVDKLAWGEDSAEVAKWFDEPGPWVIEGVTVARALRKWLKNNDEGKPCDRVIWLETPKKPLTEGQNTMRKGVVAVWNQIQRALIERGVKIDSGPRASDVMELSEPESKPAETKSAPKIEAPKSKQDALRRQIEEQNRNLLRSSIPGLNTEELDAEALEYIKTWYS